MNVKHYTEGPNNYRVEIGNLTLWFSYETIIAFQTGGKRFVCENVWSPTTGKHLSRIDGGIADAKKSRTKRYEFSRLLDGSTERLASCVNLAIPAPAASE